MTLSEMIGRRLGTYEIVAELGRGGNARVYKARDTEASRDVAIKLIPNDAENRQLFVRRFQFEIEVVRKLNHPHIVAVYDAGETEELVYLVMQCVEGGTLRDRITRGPLAVPLAVTYAVQMAQALHHAHRQGIVHRDVKPSNMLIDTADPNRLLLTDFGIAKIQGLRGITKSGTTMGTPEYMSPEQSQARESDPRTDIYSLGCVLYEMLAGRPPFKAPLPVSVLYQHVYARPPFIRGYNDAVPPELAHIIETALQKNPDDRFPTAEHLARALMPFMRPGYKGKAIELQGDETLPPLPIMPPTPLDALSIRRETRESGPLGPWPLALQDYGDAVDAVHDAADVDDAIVNADTVTHVPAVSRPLAQSGPRPATESVSQASAGPLSDLIDADVRQALIESERLVEPEHPSSEAPIRRRTLSKTNPLRGLELPARPPNATGANLARYTGSPVREDELDRLYTPRVTGPGVDKVNTLKPALAGEEAVRWPQTLAVAEASARQRRKRHHPLRTALVMVALLVLVAGGTLVLSATGIAAIPLPIPIVRAQPTPSPTLAPTATLTPEATATAVEVTPTAISQQAADREASASFRAVALGPGPDPLCSSPTTTTFTAGSSIYISLCTASSVAASNFSVSVHPPGGNVCTLPGVGANRSYNCVSQFTLAPGQYDMVVTMRIDGTTGTARDLRFTVTQ